MYYDDLEKILIVDSPIVPFYLRATGVIPSSIVIDASDGTYTATQLVNASKFYFPNSDIVIKEVDAPSLWFSRSNIIVFLYNLIKFELKLRAVKKFFILKDACFYGSRTSSLMLLQKPKNRILIDHGIGEPIERLLQISNRKKPLHYIKRMLGFLFKYFLRPPQAAFIYSCFEDSANISQFNVRPFSICVDSFKKVSLFKDMEFVNNKHVIVVLFGNTPHDGTLKKFEISRIDTKGNAGLLKRAIDLCDQDSIVICKFHPSVKEPLFHFQDLCRWMQLNSLQLQKVRLWDDLVENGFEMLPIEMIWLNHKVSHVFCEHSAVGFTTREFASKVEFHLTSFGERNSKNLRKKLKLISSNLNIDIDYK